MLHTLSNLPRSTKKILLVCADFFILYLALWSSFFIRLEEWWPKVLNDHWQTIVWGPILAIPAFFYLGLYNAVIRYIAPRFMITIIKASSIATLFLFSVVAMGMAKGVPRSSYLLYWVIATMLLGGVRMVVREILPVPSKEAGVLKKRVIVYGAGAAGTQTAKALQSSIEYEPVAFVDNNKDIQGWEILGVKVYSPSQLPVLVKERRVAEVVVSIPSLSRAARKQVIDSLAPLPVLVKTLPGLPGILDGNVTIDDIKVVEIEDLLGRDPVAPNEALMASCIQGKTVLVSGAGGSIGSELCRQIVKQHPRRLLLFELNEFNLYAIHREIRERHPDLEVIPLLGSVQDDERVRDLLRDWPVDTIYHAAAYKHVPIVESNKVEGVSNNIFGTYTLARAAIDARVSTFILISTDKAVRPTSVMGASKRFAEIILQGLARTKGPTRFSMVRFGNVLGSSGSVVPLFRRQIRSGGPVTITHPEMTRYFMTIPEAAQLVIQAGAMGQGGDVFLLDMGKPVRIMDLARNMIELSGLTVRDEQGRGEIAIKLTGLRPGEKLYEELLIGENPLPTEHPRIKRAEEEFLNWPEVAAFLAEFEDSIHTNDEKKLVSILQRSVVSYKPHRQAVPSIRKSGEQCAATLGKRGGELETATT